MTTDTESKSPLPPGYGIARPLRIPRPTFWPAAMAFGITFLAWSLVTSMVVGVAGAIVFAVALTGWIKEALHEQEGPDEEA
jgi:hypothetical protein